MIEYKDMETGRKLDKLFSKLKGYGSCLVAFSGGVDSAFLAAAAARVLGRRAVCATVVFPYSLSDEHKEAGLLVRKIGIRHFAVKARMPTGVRFNPEDRCYRCKKMMASVLLRLARAEGLSRVIEGSIPDDRFSHRPGNKALREAGIASPLVEAGFNKSEIRFLLRRWGVPGWDKCSRTCLATRFPHREELTPAKLEMVDRAEAYLRKLGTRCLRVRCRGAEAKIEVDPEKFVPVARRAREITRKLKGFGFSAVALDLSGAINEGEGWKKSR